MKLGDLIHKELRSRYIVYISNDDTITNYERLFDGFYDVTNEDEVKEWKHNYRKYFDYEVVYFYAEATNNSEYPTYKNAYTKIVITKPVVEELPF